MRPITQTLEPAGLILGQPRMDRLARHPEPSRHLGDRVTLADHRQHRLIPLLATLISLMDRSVNNQPKQLSTISRNSVNHQPKPQCQASAEATHTLARPRQDSNLRHTV